ncbi:protein-tyrosine phosphatase-like protein [Biscogniauxia mediterranea]|nr:protein-tyrosine phosphatase-like protein [Biscogniauxia mediterranea]
MDSTSLHHTTFIPAAPYSSRPPSPPSIVIPTPIFLHNSEPMKVVPSYANIDPASLSMRDLEIITQNGKTQVAHDSGHSWAYESRRTAQPVLDFLYLGPSSVARDRKWLREHGITLLLAARDAQMAEMRLMAVDKVAEELGIQAEHVDVRGYHELIRAFPSTVRKINDHMLSVYREQALSSPSLDVQDGSMVINGANFRRGKVLVFCETGNDRSAGIVVAYLMAVFGMHMVQACQFIHYKRFCVSLDEEMKYVLKTYEGILLAQRTVHQHELTASHDAELKKGKRGHDDAMDEDQMMGEGGEGLMKSCAPDQDRFHGRGGFAPFLDAREITMKD